jgi:hypothetical protein
MREEFMLVVNDKIRRVNNMGLFATGVRGITLSALATTALLLAVGAPVHAANGDNVLLPGDANDIPVVTTFSTLGTLLNTSTSVGTTSTVYSAVYQQGSTFNFVYQVKNTAGGPTLTQFTVQPYSSSGGTVFDATLFYASDAQSIFTASTRTSVGVDRSTLATNNGATITYRFPSNGGGQVTNNQFTAPQIVSVTNATGYTTGTVSTLIGTSTENLTGFVPTNVPIPEPGTLPLLVPALLGGIGIAVRRRRRPTVH